MDKTIENHKVKKKEDENFEEININSSYKHNVCESCDNKWKIIVAAILHLAFVALAIHQIYHLYNKKSHDNLLTSSVDSQRRFIEERLLQSINFSVDPCTNFYEFTCGNWIQHDSIPNHMFRTSTSTELETKLLRKIENYLNAENSQNEPKMVHEARKMYKSCVNSQVRSIDEKFKQVAYLLQQLHLPSVPNFSKKSKHFSWVLPTIMNKKLLDNNFFFQFSIRPDPYITNANRIYITNPSSCFYSKYNDLDAKSRVGFYKFIHSIATYMYEKNNLRWSALVRLTFRHRFTKLFKFSKELEKLDAFSNSSYLADYVSIDDLQLLTDSIFKRKNKNSKIDWATYVEKMFENSVITLNLNRTDRLILVPSKQYIAEVLKLLLKTPPHILEFYIWSKTIFTILPFTNSVLIGKYNEYLQKFFGKQRPPRDLYCSDLVHKTLYYATSYFMVKDVNTKRKISEISEMFVNIQGAFADELKQGAWLDEETRVKALNKLQTMKTNIGYPEWMNDLNNIDIYYGNITLSSEDLLQNILEVRTRNFQKMLLLYKTENIHENENPWIGHILQVNAFYYSFYNSITIPIGILAYPFYDLGIQAMNYGAIGMIIGHELTHGFDETGKEFDADGHLRSWWSYRTKLEYERRAKCFVNNYDQFVINYMKTNDDSIQVYFDGLLTLNENIADHGGLRIALNAYKNYIKTHGSESLFNKLNFTAEQLFFIAFTHSRCEHISEEMRELELTDEHGLNVLRVLATLSSSNEFADAWKCRTGSPMNPSEKKCRLW